VIGRLTPDIVMETTGAPVVIRDCLGRAGRNGIICLLGLSAAGTQTPLDLAFVNRTMVLENQVVFGSVNANRAHYEAAARALRDADRDWLARLITRRVALANFQEALENRPDDLKVIVDFTRNHVASH
jgi:threonine dehydrogenase-like Zn-dependent dehydrogenase